MRRIQLLIMAMIAIAVGAGATINSYTSEGIFAAPLQTLPNPQPARTAHSADMPIATIPAEAVDPTAMLYRGTGDGSNDSLNRP
jgi:hypothetical protein